MRAKRILCRFQWVCGGVLLGIVLGGSILPAWGEESPVAAASQEAPAPASTVPAASAEPAAPAEPAASTEPAPPAVETPVETPVSTPEQIPPEKIFEQNERQANEALPLYLTRKNGKLVAIPGIQLEQVEEILRKYSREAAAPKDAVPMPDYALHSLLGEAIVEENVLRIQMTLQIETFRDAPVRVPLRFDEGILLESPSPEKASPDGEQATVDRATVDTTSAPDSAPAASPTLAEKLVQTVTQMRQSIPAARQYTGAGRLWVEFSESSGFVAWILGKGTHTLGLTFLVPISSAASEKRFSLQFPHATTSELRFRLPQSRKDSSSMTYSMEGGTTLQPAHFQPSSEDPNQGNTQIIAMRLGGGFTFSWNVHPKATTDTPSVLEAEGLIFALLEKDAIRYDARLKILGGEANIETFQVRLPKNAELLPISEADYTLTRLENTSGDMPLVEVRMKEKRSGVLRVDIPVKVPLSATASEWFDVSGFEVLSAVRQSGYYAVRTAVNQYANWAAGEEIQRYDELPVSLNTWGAVAIQETPLVPASLFEGGAEKEKAASEKKTVAEKKAVTWDAVFEYLSQPTSLWARVVRRSTRVHISPQYRVTVSRDDVQLDATWDCTIRGGKVAWLDLDMQDWTLNSVGPGNLVSGDSLEVNEDGRVSIPLAQAVTGHVTLTFHATRKLPETEAEIRLTLPKKAASSLPTVVTTMAPAELMILSEANIELTPDTDACVRLVRQPVSPTSEWITSDTPEMLLYRTESEDAVFAAQRDIHRRTVTVRERTRLDVFKQEYRVVQTFEYTVAYGGISQLQFQIPEINAEKLEVRLVSNDVSEKTPIPALEMSSTEPVHEPIPGAIPGAIPESVPSAKPLETKLRPSVDLRSRLLNLDVSLPHDRMGTFTLELRYALPLEKNEHSGQATVEFRFAEPQGVRLVENLLEVSAESSVQFLPLRTFPENAAWKELGAFSAYREHSTETVETESYRKDLTTRLLCQSETSQSRIMLGIEAKTAVAADITTMDRCWLQTWLTGSVRQDRAVFLFPPMADSLGETTSADSPVPARTFTLHIPQGASADETEVWIDRRAAQFGTEIKRLTANTLQVVLPPVEKNIPRTVEIRYQLEEKLPMWGTLTMEVPYVQNITWIRGMYWQLILPGDTHVFSAPQELSMEYLWGWSQCFWGRVPRWEQGSLERWSGALTGSPAPMRMNRYVFAGTGMRDDFVNGTNFWLMNRTVLVIGVAVILYWLGLMFLFFPILRKPPALLAMLLTLGACAARSPDLALLGLQSISLGVLLLLISISFGLFQFVQKHLGKVQRIQNDDTVRATIPPNVLAVLHDGTSSVETFPEGKTSEKIERNN